ncbi:MAG: hypothetical protein F4Z82_02870 [Caldilineaceae bacterium SB0668_bin_21]|nr:hypothetical protein [Caldilineaceae bacterium SB0668_bin_21]MXX24378.1 hypothetical protein [Caldilineaceae bacterium SB0668_bin_21]
MTPTQEPPSEADAASILVQEMMASPEELVRRLAFALGHDWGDNAQLSCTTRAEAEKHYSAVTPPNATPRYHGGFPLLAAVANVVWPESFRAGFEAGWRCGALEEFPTT